MIEQDPLPWLVFSNSSSDYRILCASAPTDERLLRLIDDVARQWGDLVSPQFIAAVGICPLGADNRVVIRIFDSGVFKGRPHTLGIVAVVVPRRSARNWRLGDFLATLTPPVPDTHQYSLSEPALAPAIGDSSVFGHLNQWEMEQGDRPLLGPVWFSAPPALTRSGLAQSPRPTRGNAGTRYRVLLVMVLAVLSLTGWLACTCLRPPASPPSPAAQPDYTAMKESLMDALHGSFSESELRAANPNRLAQTVIDYSTQLQSLCNERRTDLLNPSLSEKGCRDIVGGFLNDAHDQGTGVNHSLTEYCKAPSKEDVDNALAKLHKYIAVVRAAEAVQKAGEEDFPSRFNALKNVLRPQ